MYLFDLLSILFLILIGAQLVLHLEDDPHFLLDELEDVGVDVVGQVDVGDGLPELLDLGQGLLVVVVPGKVLDHEPVDVALPDGGVDVGLGQQAPALVDAPGGTRTVRLLHLHESNLRHTKIIEKVF